MLPSLFLAALLGLLLAASVHDVMARTIPGALCAAIAGLGLLARYAGGDLSHGVLAACLVFAGAWVCWRRGWLGGGDVKLLAAAALAVPPGTVPAMLAATAIAGAGLALLYLAARRVVPAAAGARPRALWARAARAERWRIARGGPLPYAVAIAFGMAVVLIQPSLSGAAGLGTTQVTWHGPEARA